jgi:hypothetical protein
VDDCRRLRQIFSAHPLVTMGATLRPGRILPLATAPVLWRTATTVARMESAPKSAATRSGEGQGRIYRDLRPLTCYSRQR